MVVEPTPRNGLIVGAVAALITLAVITTIAFLARGETLVIGAVAAHAVIAPLTLVVSRLRYFSPLWVGTGYALATLLSLWVLPVLLIIRAV